MPGSELEKKHVVITDRCFEMLDEAMDYLIDHYAPGQAEIMNSQFFAAAKLLETTPWIGTKYKDDMRTIKLGKFRYNIFYRETETKTEILGIWHTSRGTEFEES